MLTPEKKTVKYLGCTIHPFDNTVISAAFGLDLNAYYNGLETTYGDVIHSRALALKKPCLCLGIQGKKISEKPAGNISAGRNIK